MYNEFTYLQDIFGCKSKFKLQYLYYYRNLNSDYDVTLKEDVPIAIAKFKGRESCDLNYYTSKI